MEPEFFFCGLTALKLFILKNEYSRAAQLSLIDKTLMNPFILLMAHIVASDQLSDSLTNEITAITISVIKQKDNKRNLLVTSFLNAIIQERLRNQLDWRFESLMPLHKYLLRRNACLYAETLKNFNLTLEALEVFIELARYNHLIRCKLGDIALSSVSGVAKVGLDEQDNTLIFLNIDQTREVLTSIVNQASKRGKNIYKELQEVKSAIESMGMVGNIPKASFKPNKAPMRTLASK